MRRFALIGADVAGSHSKRIHERIWAGNGIEAEYDLVSVRPEELECALDMLRNRYEGFNVTMPYKQEIMRYLDGATKQAERLHSCNTVSVRGKRLYGANTDGEGFARSLRGFYAPAGKKALLLGAGGAAAAVADALAEMGARLTVCNRTTEKAKNLVEKLKICAKVCPSGMSFSEKYDIIVNTTSVGMGPQEGQTPLEPASLPPPEAVVDIIYRPWRTRLLAEAERAGIPVLNGFPMLFYQAAAADRIWLGLSDPAEEETLAALTKEIRG